MLMFWLEHRTLVVFQSAVSRAAQSCCWKGKGEPVRALAKSGEAGQMRVVAMGEISGHNAGGAH